MEKTTRELGPFERFIDRVPWETILIWCVFLGLLYSVRHFFFVIFLTFLVSYCMRTIIVGAFKRLPQRFQTRWIEISVTIMAFIGLLFAVYGVGAYLAPELVKQGQEFVKRVSSPEKNPKVQFDYMLQNTMGRWLFHQKYGGVDGDVYKSALAASGSSSPQLFEEEERKRLTFEWKRGELADKLEQQLQGSLAKGMTLVGGVIGGLIPILLYLPFQFLLILLLSFFITVDIPNMKRGLAKLRESRVKNFYEEIAPSLSNFGRLIGRAFQAQGVIAIINTVLTYLFCIRLLGLQHGVFLSTMVFICSFIPVVGVVLSGIPICIVAMTQDDGGIIVAVWAILSILIVHFAETSLFNPKIMGDMLHLHPVLVLAILAISEHFFGVWGLLLGVPVAVYIIRFVILDEGIPGWIEPVRKRAGSGSE